MLNNNFKAITFDQLVHFDLANLNTINLLDFEKIMSNFSTDNENADMYYLHLFDSRFIHIEYFEFRLMSKNDDPDFLLSFRYDIISSCIEWKDEEKNLSEYDNIFYFYISKVKELS